LGERIVRGIKKKELVKGNLDKIGKESSGNKLGEIREKSGVSDRISK
jgi:hypothetical protein